MKPPPYPTSLGDVYLVIRMNHGRHLRPNRKWRNRAFAFSYLAILIAVFWAYLAAVT